MKAYLDTAVLVAASVADHPHHSQSLTTLQMVRKKTITGHISCHGLSEVYAVLTRTPFAPPIYPTEAWKLLSVNVLPYFQIVTLTPKMYRETIQECAERGWIGARIYDALHLLTYPGCAGGYRNSHSYTGAARIAVQDTGGNEFTV